MPVRCLSVFQQVYRDIAAKHQCMLVDSQALFHAIGPHGLLDDHLFNDFVHPALTGHVTLAKAILDKLRERKALGWPSDTPTPKLDAALCATHFGIGPADWAYVCQNSKGFYGVAAYLRYDPRQSRRRRHSIDRRCKEYQRVSRQRASGFPISEYTSPCTGASAPVEFNGIRRKGHALRCRYVPRPV